MIIPYFCICIKNRKYMKIHSRIVWICGTAAIILAVTAFSSLLNKDRNMNLIIGTYGTSIYGYSFDPESGDFSLNYRASADNASYAIAERSEDGSEHIYTVSEKGGESGVYSFYRNNGDPERVSDKRQTGADPCFAMLYEYKDRRFMLTADYSGGSVSVFPVQEGRILDCCQTLSFTGSGPVKERQESSHIHQLKCFPSGTGSSSIILATDLGADKIHILEAIQGQEELFSHTGSIECPAGSGPRHMEFSKDGKMLYVIGELSGEVLAYSIKAGDKPEFKLIQRIQADEVNAGGSADIHLHPSGRFLYTSHRLDNDGISVFEVRDDGTLEKIAYTRTARHPRNFFISPDGDILLCASRDDRVIQIYRINEDGTLTIVPKVLRLEDDMPVSITLIK